jgi:hypothetical protein
VACRDRAPACADRDIVLIVLDAIEQFIRDVIQTGRFGTPTDLAGSPAQESFIAAVAADEFERGHYVVEASGHRPKILPRHRASSPEYSMRHRSTKRNLHVYHGARANHGAAGGAKLFHA